MITDGRRNSDASLKSSPWDRWVSEFLHNEESNRRDATGAWELLATVHQLWRQMTHRLKPTPALYSEIELKGTLGRALALGAAVLVEGKPRQVKLS